MVRARYVVVVVAVEAGLRLEPVGVEAAGGLGRPQKDVVVHRTGDVLNLDARHGNEVHVVCERGRFRFLLRELRQDVVVAVDVAAAVRRRRRRPVTFGARRFVHGEDVDQSLLLALEFADFRFQILVLVHQRFAFLQKRYEKRAKT